VAERPIIAVCGKGGVGKTVLTALLAKTLIDGGVKPLLLIDADPAGGLMYAIGEQAAKTMSEVRQTLVNEARGADGKRREQLADQLDYLVMQALVERVDYSFLAMGHGKEKGCYCPANTLLRGAIELLATPFAAVLIDAEAGIEQINRQVTRKVTQILSITDGSARGNRTLQLIADMVGQQNIYVVTNRIEAEIQSGLPDGVKHLGALPEDETIREFDRRGQSLWQMPDDNPVVLEAARIARVLIPVGKMCN
jgi:CO dehydrogenase maturation factor